MATLIFPYCAWKNLVMAYLQLLCLWTGLMFCCIDDKNSRVETNWLLFERFGIWLYQKFKRFLHPFTYCSTDEQLMGFRSLEVIYIRKGKFPFEYIWPPNLISTVLKSQWWMMLRPMIWWTLFHTLP